MSLSEAAISYCTNVHAGRTVAEVDSGLDEFTVKVREQSGRPLAAGLWLARSVVSELLAEDGAVERFRDRLIERDLPCYTLNTFPFGDFHSERVKENVYLPDWSTKARRQYTVDCATVLASLLPEGVEGSMSTLPLGGRMNTPDDPANFHQNCFQQLVQTAQSLKAIFEETGKLIRLAVEPEPCCEMSSIPDQAVPLFRRLREYAADQNALDEVNRYIGLCFDVCHQAVEFEDVAASIDLLVENEIRINKVHISNAIELQNPETNLEGRSALVRFVEPRYLHQTFAKTSDGRLLTRTDLESKDVLRQPSDYTDFDRVPAWRVHFHVPVNAEELGPLKTTRTELRRAISRVEKLDYAPHLEIETYTWEVLPDGKFVELVTGLCQEIEATHELLAEARNRDAGDCSP
ncbi:MAG: metabolite traffic protein EboE [Planctomycetaceae bacterium]